MSRSSLPEFGALPNVGQKVRVGTVLSALRPSVRVPPDEEPWGEGGQARPEVSGGSGSRQRPGSALAARPGSGRGASLPPTAVRPVKRRGGKPGIGDGALSVLCADGRRPFSHCHVPTALLANPLDVLYVPLPFTVTVLVKAGVLLHVASLGAYRLNVIDPVGLVPPLSVPLSFSVAPTVALAGFGDVVSVGVDLTVTNSQPSAPGG